jgi:hypothetical protein
MGVDPRGMFVEKCAVQVTFVAGTVMVYGVVVVPSFQPVKTQGAVAVATSVALFPTGYVPPPVTEPPLGGFARTFTAVVVFGAKANTVPLLEMPPSYVIP